MSRNEEFGSRGVSTGEGSCLREAAGSSHWEMLLLPAKHRPAISRRVKSLLALCGFLAALSVTHSGGGGASMLVTARREAFRTKKGPRRGVHGRAIAGGSVGAAESHLRGRGRLVRGPVEGLRETHAEVSANGSVI